MAKEEQKAAAAESGEAIEKTTTNTPPEQPAKEAAAPKEEIKHDIFSEGESIDQLVNSMAAETKQEYIDPTTFVDPDASGDQSEEEAEEQAESSFQGNLPLTDDQYKANANWIIEVGDMAMAYSLSLIAQDENSDYYKAKKEQKDQMVMALAQGLKETNSSLNIPWWVVLLVAAGIAYGPKAGEAFRKRAQKNRTEDEMGWQGTRYDRPVDGASLRQEPPTPPAPTPPASNFNQAQDAKPSESGTRICAMPGCTNELTTQKHYCSREHNNQHRAMIGTNKPKA